MKSVVLLSSGLDSTLNLHLAHRNSEVIKVLTFDYGQRAKDPELKQSAYFCSKLGLDHEVVELPFFKNFTKTSLVNEGARIPKAEDLDIHSHEKSLWSASQVWVPNRNGIFVNIGAAYAEGLGAEQIIVGFNREEAQTFPDNSGEYLQSLSHSFLFSTQNKVKVHSYTLEMDKKEILTQLVGLGVELNQLWPCYYNEEKPCGQCESCLRFKSALESKGIQWDELWQSV